MINSTRKLLNNKGQFLAELLVVIGLSSIVLPAILTGFVLTRSGRAQHDERLRAIELLGEASEAVRVVKEKGWENIEQNGTYHPVLNGNTWELQSSSETVDGYTRSIGIEDALRLNSAIVESGGSPDPSTKKITITVAWTTPLSSSVSEVAYLARYKNISHVTTTVEDFNKGVNASTVVVNSSGGEVILGAGGSGDWCDPNLSIAALDLPKSGEAQALTAIEGRAFAGTGLDASGVSFADVEITNTNPPTTTIDGSFDGYKTNGVFGETNYAYIATDTNSKEVVIIDITQVVNGKYVEAGYFNAPGNGDGLSVYTLGNTGYMTTASNLYNFDLSSKSGSRPIIDTDGVPLAGDSHKIFVYGNYVYAVTDNSSTQLQIIDVSNPTNLQIVGQALLPAGSGKDVFVNSSATRAYIANSDNKMYIVDVSTKTGNRPIIGAYSTGGMSPKGVRVATGNKAIVVGQSGEEYQVVDITNETNPVRCGGLNIDSGLTSVATVLEQDGDAFSYILSHDASAEMKIIEGGPGGQFSQNGEYTSQVLDVLDNSFFNRISFNFQEPLLTDIRLQVAGADPVSGSCTGASYVFVGPDKSPSTYFENAGLIPADNDGAGYENPARCFRFKAYLSTQDAIFTPNLYDVTVNYSP